MCTPSTAALGSQAIGLIGETGGEFFSASASRDSAKTDAHIALVNARLAELSAQSALQAGQQEEQRSRLRYAALKGTQRAAMAANGVALDSDTPQRVLASTDLMNEVDAQTISTNALRQAWGHRTEATGFRNKALSARARAAGISPFGEAGSTFLTGFGKLADKRLSLQKEGSIKEGDAFYFKES